MIFLNLYYHKKIPRQLMWKYIINHIVKLMNMIFPIESYSLTGHFGHQ